jgi:hypothetical protein
LWLWPSRDEWSRWSLPSKLTALGTLFGILSLMLGLLSLGITWPTGASDPNSPSTKPEQIESRFEMTIPASKPEREIFEEVFASDLAPGECGLGRVYYRENKLILFREAPSRNSPVILRAFAKGVQAGYWGVRYRTLAPGKVRAKKSISFEGTSFGQINHLSEDLYYAGGIEDEIFTVHANERFELLQYRGEGSCFIRLRSQVIEVHSCSEDGRLEGKEWQALETYSAPKVELWIRLIDDSRRAIGWAYFDKNYFWNEFSC